MAIRKIQITFNCKECNKEEKGNIDHILTDHDGNLETTIKREQLLPNGWISLDWLHRPENATSVFAGTRDAGDFCSKECLIKYFTKVSK